MAFRLKNGKCREAFDCSLGFGLWWRANYGVEIPPDVVMDDEGMPAEATETPEEHVPRVVAVNALPPAQFEPYAGLQSVQEELEL